jgi:transcriptional regulator with XRE-family HTH domain
MIGDEIKKLRTSKGIVQRMVAAHLDVDSAYISKMESEEKPVSRSYISRLAELFEVTPKELEIIWLADRILEVLADEPHAKEVLALVKKKMAEGVAGSQELL